MTNASSHSLSKNCKVVQKHAKFDERFSVADIAKSVEQILLGNKLCSMATANDNGEPRANCAFFTYDKSWNLFIMSSPATHHSQNVKQNHRCSITIADSHQVPDGSGLVGLQLFGVAEELSGVAATKAFALYAKRFAWVIPWAKTYQNFEKIAKSRFYKFTPIAAKVFDEPSFGRENYIEIEIERLSKD